MRMRIALLSVLIVCLLAVTFTALAGPVPRAVPDNDNIANAATLKLGKSYTIADPGAATVETDEPLGGSCGYFDGPYNSVWYTFTVDTYTKAYFSTGGSQLDDPLYSDTDTVLTLYTGPANAAVTDLVYEACNDDEGSLFSALTATLYDGDIYYLQIHTYADIDFAPTSFIKLTTRILYRAFDVANLGFEEPLGDTWTVKNGSPDDEIVCNDATYIALTGVCSFKFTSSGAEEATKIVQNVPAPSGVKLRKGASVVAYAYFQQYLAPSVENAKLVMKLTYSDGTPPTKAVSNFSGVGSGSPAWGSALTQLASAKLASVKVQVAHKSSTGVLLVDNVSVEYDAASITREAGGLLPVPAAP